MRRSVALSLVALLLLSSIAMAAPKEMKFKDVLDKVIVTEEVDQPADGQNTVTVKFPVMGDLTAMTVLRDRIEDKVDSTADYLAETVTDSDGIVHPALNGYDGGFDVVTDEDGKDWIVLGFYYSRANMDGYVVEVTMFNETNGFTYGFTFDNRVQETVKHEREMKDICDKVMLVESPYTVNNDDQSMVTLTFPKMGSVLKTMVVTRERTGTLETTSANYLDGSELEWYEGELTVITDENQNEFYQIEMVYTHGNIAWFDIEIQMWAGKGGVSFGCDMDYVPEQ